MTKRERIKVAEIIEHLKQDEEVEAMQKLYGMTGNTEVKIARKRSNTVAFSFNRVKTGDKLIDSL